MTLNELLNQILSNVFNLLVIPLLPVVTAFLIAYLKKKTSDLQSRLQNEETSRYIQLVENAICSMVSTVNQIYVDDIKAVNEHLTVEEQKNAFQMAKNQIVKIAGDTAITALNQLYNDSETYLNNRIEYYVSLAKTGKQEVLK